MGLAYLFFLLVGLGTLLVQAVLGSKDADGGGGHDVHADHDASGDHAHDHDHAHDGAGIGGMVALFTSVRFWVFAALAFGLSGTLLTYLSSVGAIPTFVTAMALGVTSGFGAALAFRWLKHISSGEAEHANQAVGRMGRVIVPVDPKSVGKIRIELGGQSMDLVAKTTGVRIERGDMVVVEDLDGEVAQVSRAPEELKS